jgi:hypothetical protein
MDQKRGQRASDHSCCSLCSLVVGIRRVSRNDWIHSRRSRGGGHNASLALDPGPKRGLKLPTIPLRMRTRAALYELPFLFLQILRNRQRTPATVGSVLTPKQ